jgi:hypothetical protein
MQTTHPRAVDNPERAYDGAISKSEMEHARQIDAEWEAAHPEWRDFTFREQQALAAVCMTIKAREAACGKTWRNGRFAWELQRAVDTFPLAMAQVRKERAARAV